MSRKLHFNGINGTTGKPLIPPQLAEDVAQWARRAHGQVPPKALTQLQHVAAANQARAVGMYGVAYGRNANDVSNVGWAVVYPGVPSAQVRAALQPLVQLRNGCELVWTPGQSAEDFVLNPVVLSGQLPPETDPAVPYSRLPYYLLVVGTPAELPWELQFAWDVEHCVGRLDLSGAAEIGAYATAVCAYESPAAQSRPRGRRLAFFATRHPQDVATESSADELVTPLASQLAPAPGQPQTVETTLGAAATKSAFHALLHRQLNPPAVVFTASHGMAFPAAQHPAVQGAILCQDWTPGTVPAPAQYYAAADVSADADLKGLLVLNFGCFTAGTPAQSEFPWTNTGSLYGGMPFSAALPCQLLRRGALACLGHVDLAWQTSFMIGQPPGQQYRVDMFRNCLRALLDGATVGYAAEAFNARHAFLATELTAAIPRQAAGLETADSVSFRWLAHNDARAYVLHGDPAVRLRF